MCQWSDAPSDNGTQASGGDGQASRKFSCGRGCRLAPAGRRLVSSLAWQRIITAEQTHSVSLKHIDPSEETLYFDLILTKKWPQSRRRNFHA